MTALAKSSGARVVGAAFLTIAASILLPAAPASAAEWTVDCLWSRTPAADRAAFLDAGTGGHREALTKLNRNALKAAITTCAIPKADEPQAQRLYNVYGSGLSALASLQSSHGISRARVLSAWAAVPAADRNRFAAIAPNMHRDPQHIAMFESLLDQMAQRLNVADAAAKGQLRQVIYSASILKASNRGAL